MDKFGITEIINKILIGGYKDKNGKEAPRLNFLYHVLSSLNIALSDKETKPGDSWITIKTKPGLTLEINKAFFEDREEWEIIGIIQTKIFSIALGYPRTLPIIKRSIIYPEVHKAYKHIVGKYNTNTANLGDLATLLCEQISIQDLFESERLLPDSLLFKKLLTSLGFTIPNRASIEKIFTAILPDLEKLLEVIPPMPNNNLKSMMSSEEDMFDDGSSPNEDTPNRPPEDSEGGSGSGEDEDDGEGTPQSGSPSLNDLGDNEEKQKAYEMMREILQKAEHKTSSTEFGAGTVPGEISDALSLKVFTPPELPWHRLIRQLTQKLQSGSEGIEFTKYRKSKITGNVPGIKRDYDRPSILILIDTSGSVSRKLFLKFINEIKHLGRIADFTFLCFDTQVYPESLTRHEHFSTDSIKFSGGGGTMFNPAIEYANEQRKLYGGAILFTDGYPYESTNELTKSINPLLYVVCGNNSFDPKNGQVAFMRDIPETY